jgi:uncharacterized protein YndB with AHSA1/START domain
MAMMTENADVRTLKVDREIEIAAPVEIVFEAMLEELGPASDRPDGKPFPMVIEPWPGGRWYRDLGQSAGHLWGHVQVINPPTLLELCGPMFMSYPAMNHLQYRLTASGDGTTLRFIHLGMGQILSEHEEGVSRGWQHKLGRIVERSNRLKAERG